METKLELINKGIKGIIFKIGENEKMIESFENLCGIINHLEDYKNFVETYTPYIKYYENFEQKIDDILKDFHNDENEYSIGENFAIFLNYLNKPKINNNDAKKIVLKMYEDKYGTNHTLLFDSEYSFCYVYTKDKEEAKRFLLFTYNDIVKPFLTELENDE